VTRQALHCNFLHGFPASRNVDTWGFPHCASRASFHSTQRVIFFKKKTRTPKHQ
jgi:hypothetical protein